MITLKANPELKAVFMRLFKTMGLNVAWNDLFLIINNNLILPGSVRSLFFQFDNKKISTNIVDIPFREDMIEQIDDNVMLSNTLNMTLYAFGKWGIINGLKVEKDYAQLNRLFTGILKDVKIEPSFRDDNFRFFKEGIQITYEEVVQDVINLKKEEEKGINATEENGGITGEYELGLWHNMCWRKQSQKFLKKVHSESDDSKLRVGNNFYMVDYKCPGCGGNLHMVIFPVNQEFLIETDGERVYLARAYTCNTCNCFYTPLPQKLLQEGEVYALEFDEDRQAYEDYKELLGRTGTRNSNYKLNEYESERNKKKQMPSESPLEELCKGLEKMSEDELQRLQDKMNCGFYPWADADKYYTIVEEQLSALKQQGKNVKAASGKQISAYNTKEVQSIEPAGTSPKQESPELERVKEAAKDIQDFSSKTIKELKDIMTGLQSAGMLGGGKEKGTDLQSAVREQLSRKLKIKYDADTGNLTAIPVKELQELREEIESESLLEEEEKKEYLSNINMILYQNEVKAIARKTEACRDKSYAEISHVINEIKNGNAPGELKEEALKALNSIKRQRGEKEAAYFIANMPADINKKQYNMLKEKLAQYPEVDMAPYENELKKQYDAAEKKEIASFINQASKRSREDLLRLYDRLKEQDYSEENKVPFLEKINDKILDMDKAAIQKICPDIMEMTFDQGMKAFEEISEGVFLPQLKANTLEMLNRRLTKIKLDECSQLVRKLKRDIDEKLNDYEKLYFYEPRSAMREEKEPEAVIIDNALQTYASDRNQYEFPIMVCDTSRLSNGKEGFILSPDNFYYKRLFGNGAVSISVINSVTENTGILNRGIFMNLATGKKIRIPVSLKASEWKAFAGVLNDFVTYLQEKPESRSIAYMAKEKHEVKCCYRCGYSYKGGSICPKCGSKSNR